MANNPYGKKPKVEEVFTPFSELCHYAEEFGMTVELDKPFEEFDQLLLVIRDTDGNTVHSVTLEDIADLNQESAKLLNEESKNKR